MHTPEPPEHPAWYYRYNSRVLDRASMALGMAVCLADAVVRAVNTADPLGYLSTATLAGAIVVSRRNGGAGLAVAVAGAVLAIVTSPYQFAGWLVVITLIFSMALKGHRMLIAAPGAGLALYLAEVQSQSSGFTDPLAYLAFSTTIAVAAIGYAIRTQENYLEAVRRRAHDAIVSRDLEIASRITEERLRIARDLHDVVGHEIAVISMNLGVIDVHMPPDARPREALTAAQDGVRRVLQEMQNILGVLRRGEDSNARSAPPPSIEHVPDLVQALEAAGATVHSTLPTDVTHIDNSVSVAAYRIAQEALTNAHRHGGGAIQLRIQRGVGSIVVDVQNEVDVASQPLSGSGGYGMVGMRERVEAAGGHLEVSDRNGTFKVTATLPTDTGIVR